ncbi:hypothetical protein [Acidisoma sp. 7E03]
MALARDYQRSRVYAWERAALVPHDPTTIARSQAQAMVNAIWADLGRSYPPKVRPLSWHAATLLGRADRLTIELPPRCPSWCLLHELAHTMTSTLEDDSDGHGPNFMAAYITLLTRYLRLDAAALRRRAAEAGIDVASSPEA